MKASSAQDYRNLARRRLPAFLFEYIDGGSFAEDTLVHNESDLRKVKLRQTVLRKISSIDLSTSWFGQRSALPVALGPIGLAGMNARRGEVQAARAAEAAGVPFILSNSSVCSIEEVASQTSQPIWFQGYMIRDRAFMVDLLARAKAAGCPALVFTVDVPMAGLRYRDYKTGLAGPPGWHGAMLRIVQAVTHPSWAWDVGIQGRPHRLGNMDAILGKNSGLEDFLGWVNANFDPQITWTDLEFLRAHWDGPLILKGILAEEDARTAVSIGADGIVVSNHGGRQMDGVSSTASMLPKIVDAVDGRLTVLVDGGVRSGLDVIRMLALGADGVLLGRAWVYALAAAGQAGVEHFLHLIEKEMRCAMTLLGCDSVTSLNRSILLDMPEIVERR